MDTASMKWVVRATNHMLMCPVCKSAQLCGQMDNSQTVPCAYGHESPMIVPALPIEGEPDARVD